MLISIVVPCYYSEKTITKVVELTLEEFKRSEGEYECEFVLVNDGSKDGTFQQIEQLCEKYSFVKGINLLRNFGQHNALMAALNYVTGDYVVGMDDDMQTHPSQMFKLIHKIQEGYDVVYGYYPKRKNSVIKNFTSWLNRVTSRVLLNRPKEIVSSNYWIITKKVAQEVIKYDSYNPYVDAIFYRVTHNIANVEIEHFKREVGTSNYTLGKLIKLWLAYFNYSVIPLRISSLMGVIMAGIGFVATIVTVIRKILNPDMLTGWTSIICLMLIFFGLVLVSLGIIGEYLGKILLTINHTPQYIVRETKNVELEDE